MKQKYYLSLADAKAAIQELSIKTLTEYKKRYKENPLLPCKPNRIYFKEWTTWREFLDIESHIYSAFHDAMLAVQELSIKTRHEYIGRYKEDPRLPSNPNKWYSAEWVNWTYFLQTRSNFYIDIKDAQLAVKTLSIKSKDEYHKRYKEDYRLPSHPQQTYDNKWTDWQSFLGTALKFYSCISEAQQAIKALSIKTKYEYQKRYKEDPSLPSNPSSTYSNEWKGWTAFCNAAYKVYLSLAEAKISVKVLGIKTTSEYFERYKEDRRLPANPSQRYANEWSNWSTFLNIPKTFYPNLEQAQNAAQALKIKKITEYKKRYTEDPSLPAAPDAMYKSAWVSWATFLNTANKFYPNLANAQKSVHALTIKSRNEYRMRYKEDPQLTSIPEKLYASEWSTWENFLNTKNKIYPNLFLAQQATQALSISSITEYRHRYKEDPYLSACPDRIYPEEWHSWMMFFGRPTKEFYSSLEEAQQAAQALSIAYITEYTKRYKEDPRLPAHPNIIYPSEWTNWPDFLNSTSKFYPNILLAQQATLALSISTTTEYRQRYKEDSRLPANPHKIYSQEWSNWPTFLKTSKNYYLNLADAQKAVQALQMMTITEYKKAYIKDPLLPCSPERVFANEWVSWSDFLNNAKEFYPTQADAQQATHVLEIKTQIEYSKRYKEDPCLPASPNVVYANVWQGWPTFLLPKTIVNIETLKIACKVLNITSSITYRTIQKEYKQLPSKPDKKFKNWVDWYDLLNIPRPYSYEELRLIVLKYKCKTFKDYNNIRTKLNDPQMPSSPEEVYKSCGWTNSYDFFGTVRPYQIKYFAPKWKEWADLVVEFLRSAKGGDTKIKDLCEFIREYIEPNGFEISPLEYLTRGKTNIQPMLEMFEKVSVVRKKKWLFSVNEFLSWIIGNYLTIEDEDTGEVSRIKGAKNPFLHINFDGEQAPVSLNETNKLALPYQFVKSAREWILPPNSMLNKTSYSELHHLLKFSADWIQIDDSFVIDPSDPDCVTKIDGDKKFLWLPIYWTYTYALMQLPARGRQIVYCDSGEADSEVPEIQNNKIVWKQNLNILASRTKHQSMVSKTKDNDFGVYYTSNKTNFNGEGYAIPFMPQELAYWLIKLRKWQEKYNPIDAPTKWFDCTRTNLNEIQRKQKGINCFLFRDYQENEPGTFAGRLASRLAAALFFSSEDQLVSATFSEQNFNECHHQLALQQSIALTPFKSAYTPHSMRVSLINAYAYEFGMPLEVIMKLVGHSSIIMSIYYLKSGKTGANIRERIELGEKQALSQGAETLRGFIESQRIEQCKTQLIANNPEFLLTINNARPSSSYLFKDFGICPVGGAFCSDGGAPVAMKANIYHPVNAGYLGEQNCIQCRFFVTGPAFMMGLTALFNEVSLAVNTQSHRYAKLESELNKTVTQIDVLSHEIYQQKIQNEHLAKLEAEKLQLQATRRKLNSEIETRAKKMDLYMSDMNSTHKHLISCKKILNQEKPLDSSKLHLLVPHEFEVSFELNDVSGFHQLSEVCENAELYHSCSDELAVTRRSQALDKMLIQNGLNPQFVFLSEEQQLAVGNQMTQLMLTRLQSWEKIDKLINGSLVLKDFTEMEGFSSRDIKELFANSTPLKLVN